MKKKRRPVELLRLTSASKTGIPRRQHRLVGDETGPRCRAGRPRRRCPRRPPSPACATSASTAAGGEAGPVSLEETRRAGPLLPTGAEEHDVALPGSTAPAKSAGSISSPGRFGVSRATAGPKNRCSGKIGERAALLQQVQRGIHVGADVGAHLDPGDIGSCLREIGVHGPAKGGIGGVTVRSRRTAGWTDRRSAGPSPPGPGPTG